MLVVDVQSEMQIEQFQYPDGPVEFGRIPDGASAACCVVNDPHVSKRQLRIELLSEGNVRLQNLSQTTTVWLSDGSNIALGGSRDSRLPLELSMGKTRISIKQTSGAVIADAPAIPPIAPITLPPTMAPPDATMAMRDTAPLGMELEEAPFRAPSKDRSRLQTVNEPTRGKSAAVLASLGDSPTPEQLASWFETVIGVQRAAASSTEFYQTTARAVCELIGLDVGMVLLRKNNRWEIIGRHSTRRGEDMSFSRTTLKYVVEERRTFYHGFGSDAKVASASLQDAKAVVASPIFDETTDEVIGVVYGSASLFGFGRAAEIRPLEAQMVQVLAAAVGVGLARMASEAEAARRKVQFEQFLSPVLMRELDRDPNLLEGKEREVTMFFTDIRNFSQHSEQLGPRETCNLVRDVMEKITTRVVELDGVVVDYYGDGLCAMWNAPIVQADHAARACRAALAMVDDLPEVNAKWAPIIGSPVATGVGINTGHALVGNTGTQRKFKYGAMGKVVNMASRVEGATKHLGVRMLISGATRAQLGNEFATRRMGKVRVVGASEGIDLYELRHNPDPTWIALRLAYESALDLYEAGFFSQAQESLQEMLAGMPAEKDTPTAKLAARVTQYCKRPPDPFVPVLDLDSK